ncbi:hypothetical protein RHSIM_RhsimUnG0018000 [Rhododendron simsii]|uniref:Transposase n=1 Tax=Rhododendron simsii TaxID=118357 RepID=A0A834FZY9_RHOSS|nr:hypothetical protein RHSIM_RhsimUnG0018000 [Rhododendron simsii]
MGDFYLLIGALVAVNTQCMLTSYPTSAGCHGSGSQNQMIYWVLSATIPHFQDDFRAPRGVREKGYAKSSTYSFWLVDDKCSCQANRNHYYGNQQALEDLHFQDVSVKSLGAINVLRDGLQLAVMVIDTLEFICYEAEVTTKLEFLLLVSPSQMVITNSLGLTLEIRGWREQRPHKGIRVDFVLVSRHGMDASYVFSLIPLSISQSWEGYEAGYCVIFHHFDPVTIPYTRLLLLLSTLSCYVLSVEGKVSYRIGQVLPRFRPTWCSFMPCSGVLYTYVQEGLVCDGYGLIQFSHGFLDNRSVSISALYLCYFGVRNVRVSSSSCLESVVSSGGGAQDMDKNWMKIGMTADGRISQLYYNGVTSFIQFARAVIDAQGNIPCPCLKCVNFYRKSPEVVRIHLIQHGIMQSYIIWHEHGEPRESDNVRHHEMRDGDLGGIDALVEDRIRGEPIDATQHEEVQNFDKLLNDSQREIYPGSKDYTLLKFVIEVFNMKVTNHWTNKSLDMFLKFQIKLLPEGNLVPKNTYEARKLLSGLGLSYELIDGCINDCILFRNENAALDRCPKCNVSRYKINCARGKKIARKTLRYFPLTPRLKRLFMSRAIAEALRWHVNNPTNGKESGHPAHSDEWKEFDVKHPDFACEARNVRLGIATDGFNPFGNMSNSYSMWPVILIPYNLPPWLVMKDSFVMLTLLIPGDKQPGIDIDVYLRPLIDELKELWHTGTLTYDAASCEWFQMRAAFWWTLHDWPALGDISGWRTKGHYSCYTCNDEPYFESLRSKTAYTNHRAYLPEDHAERRKRLAYNGKPKNRKRSLELPVEKIQHQLNNVSGVIFGKNPANKKRKRHKPNWTKRSILHELTYVEDRKLLHNIDVMHCEKNFSENIVGTMLGIDGKNKDTDKARKDLEDKGIRKDLWLTQHGYAANISRSVSSTNGRLTGLKSHDYHILIQQILPIGMRGFVDKEISTTLFELGSFFQDLCSKTLRRSELEKLEERIVLILCKLEKIFPPAFFDVMVHLAVHLPREAILGGPVHYRWMYPIER